MPDNLRDRIADWFTIKRIRKMLWFVGVVLIGSMIHTLRVGHAPWWSYAVLAALVFVSMLHAGLANDE